MQIVQGSSGSSCPCVPAVTWETWIQFPASSFGPGPATAAAGILGENMCIWECVLVLALSASQIYNKTRNNYLLLAGNVKTKDFVKSVSPLFL